MPVPEEASQPGGEQDQPRLPRVIAAAVERITATLIRAVTVRSMVIHSGGLTLGGRANSPSGPVPLRRRGSGSGAGGGGGGGSGAGGAAVVVPAPVGVAARFRRRGAAGAGLGCWRGGEVPVPVGRRGGAKAGIVIGGSPGC